MSEATTETASPRRAASKKLLVKVPEITLIFWVLKLLTTGMGEAMSDFLWTSVLLFGAIIAIPAIAWSRRLMNPILAFWFAYVVTRPLGASFADGFSKPTNGGLNLGDGTVSAIALVIFIALVAYVCPRERRGRTSVPARPRHHAPHLELDIIEPQPVPAD